MPHKFYHGKTGVVWNVTPRAIGVIVNKRVGNRIIRKKIHVRIEHVKHSNCRKEFLERMIKNEQLKKEAKEKGSKLSLLSLLMIFFGIHRLCDVIKPQTNPIFERI